MAREGANRQIYQFKFADFLTDYEKSSPKYDEAITVSRGKIFVLERDNNGAL